MTPTPPNTSRLTASALAGAIPALAALGGLALAAPAAAQGPSAQGTSFANAANFYFYNSTQLGTDTEVVPVPSTYYYKFDVTNPGLVGLDTEGGSSNTVNATLSLYNAQQTLLASGANSVTDTLNDGFYYATVNATSLNGAGPNPGGPVGEYNVVLRSLTSTLVPGGTATFTPAGAPPSAVPEPSPLALLGLGLLPAGLIARRRRAA